MNKKQQDLLVALHAISLLYGDEKLFNDTIAVMEKFSSSKKKTNERIKGLVSVWYSWKKENAARISSRSNIHTLKSCTRVDRLINNLLKGCKNAGV